MSFNISPKSDETFLSHSLARGEDLINDTLEIDTQSVSSETRFDFEPVKGRNSILFSYYFDLFDTSVRCKYQGIYFSVLILKPIC